MFAVFWKNKRHEDKCGPPKPTSDSIDHTYLKQGQKK